MKRTLTNVVLDHETVSWIAAALLTLEKGVAVQPGSLCHTAIDRLVTALEASPEKELDGAGIVAVKADNLKSVLDWIDSLDEYERRGLPEIPILSAQLLRDALPEEVEEVEPVREVKASARIVSGCSISSSGRVMTSENGTVRVARIVSPNGANISIAQYLARKDRLTKTEFACEHGHFACAAWDRGPCSDELRAEIETGP